MNLDTPFQAKPPLCFIVTVYGKHLEVALHLATLSNIVSHFIKDESAGPDLLKRQQRGCDLLFEKQWSRGSPSSPGPSLETCPPHEILPHLGIWCLLWPYHFSQSHLQHLLQIGSYANYWFTTYLSGLMVSAVRAWALCWPHPSTGTCPRVSWSPKLLESARCLDAPLALCGHLKATTSHCRCGMAICWAALICYISKKEWDMVGVANL